MIKMMFFIRNIFPKVMEVKFPSSVTSYFAMFAITFGITLSDNKNIHACRQFNVKKIQSALKRSILILVYMLTPESHRSSQFT